MTTSSASSGGNPFDSLLRQIACLPENLPEPPENPSTDHASPTSIAADALFGFSDFRLLRELGRGAMGVVYEARQRSLDRTVALKVLQGHLLGDPKRLARFRHEANAASRSAHENIVKIYAVGEENGHHFIVEELIPGGRTLADQIHEMSEVRELPSDYYRTVARFFAQVSDALAVAPF